MKKFFDPITCNLLLEGLNRITLDSKEITEETYTAILNRDITATELVAGPDGMPILVDPPAPTYEQQQYQINAEARAYLSLTDWYVIRLQETGEPVPEDILLLRAEARSKVIHVEV